MVETWRIDCNEQRPRKALGNETSEEFEAEWQLSGNVKEDYFPPDWYKNGMKRTNQTGAKGGLSESYTSETRTLTLGYLQSDSYVL